MGPSWVLDLCMISNHEHTYIYCIHTYMHSSPRVSSQGKQDFWRILWEYNALSTTTHPPSHPATHTTRHEVEGPTCSPPSGSPTHSLGRSASMSRAPSSPPSRWAHNTVIIICRCQHQRFYVFYTRTHTPTRVCCVCNTLSMWARATVWTQGASVAESKGQRRDSSVLSSQSPLGARRTHPSPHDPVRPAHSLLLACVASPGCGGSRWLWK